jgi:hypothetical protein
MVGRKEDVSLSFSTVFTMSTTYRMRWISLSRSKYDVTFAELPMQLVSPDRINETESNALGTRKCSNFSRSAHTILLVHVECTVAKIEKSDRQRKVRLSPDS